jgi:hypothetical protein
MASCTRARRGLRSRLIELCDDALRQLDEANVLDGGLLRLLGDANAALAAIDRQPPADTEPTARAVVSDDGTEIRLTLYTNAHAAAAIDLDPVRAVRLAGKLIAAALPRLR